MGRDDWFRNKTWDEAIELEFRRKLTRARPKNRAQYLRIQACELRQSEPEVALQLIAEYLETDDRFGRAAAFNDQAHAYLSLDRFEDAVQAFRAALEQEARYPNYVTQSRVEMPYLVATRQMKPYYDDAMAVLDFEEAGLTFPVTEFRREAARALILADLGQRDAAVVHARMALEQAARTHSGLARHPTLGLVSGTDRETVVKLRQLTGSVSALVARIRRILRDRPESK